MSRTLEAIGVCCVLSAAAIFFLVPISFAYIFFFPKYWWLVGVYCTWFYHDRNTPKQGGRKIEWVRRMRVWNWLVQYFPMKIIKTAELDPSNNYLLGYHPHGMMATGLLGNFVSEANNVSGLFPGLKLSFLALELNFRIPLVREIGLAAGACSVTRQSMNYLLGENGHGNAVFMVPGGINEMIYFNPGTEVVYLKKRKGFIRVAIENGASLVPIYSFGESDIFSQAKNPPGSRLRKFQETAIEKIGVPIIFASGNGPMPRRHPITSVVGAPISVEKIANPSQDYVDQVHARYIQALSDLYYKYREQYGHSATELTIV